MACGNGRAGRTNKIEYIHYDALVFDTETLHLHRKEVADTNAFDGGEMRDGYCRPTHGGGKPSLFRARLQWRCGQPNTFTS